MLRRLADLHFPMAASQLDVFDRRDLAATLRQIGDAIAAGRLCDRGTIVIPFQERATMKVAVDLSGPHGKMWEFDMKYHKLPPEYAGEIGAAASAYASYVKTLKGGASSADPKYRITFSYKADSGDGPLAKGEEEAENLLYSQAVAVQHAGIKLLEKLMLGADMEIASGQRR